jgi:glycosyltransferase involved in cell wall biosynthesis
MNNSNNFKISIIVPVYNTAKYLPRCLNSIIGQTYTNLEIILVNDGSTDNSLMIIKEYAAKDTRINVIDINNGGQGRARNKGLDACTGDYIMFCDSDDWYDLDICEHLINALKSGDYDFAMCGIRRINGIGIVLKKYFEYNNMLEIQQDEILKRFFIDDKLLSQVCNKIYTKKLFDNLRYPEGIFYEDRFISVDLFLRTKTAIFTGKVKYNYFIRQGSTCNKPFSKADIDYVNVMIHDKEKLGDISEENKINSQYYIADAVSSVLIKLILSEKNKDKETYEYLCNMLQVEIAKMKDINDKKYYNKCFNNGYILYRRLKHFAGEILKLLRLR